MADSAYFSRENIAECLRRRLIPLFKPRGELKDQLLTRYAAFFKHAVRTYRYRYRGVAEGVYGAMEVRFGCKLRIWKPGNQVTEGLLQVCVHDLKTLIKVKEATLILIILISLQTMTLQKIYGTIPKEYIFIACLPNDIYNILWNIGGLCMEGSKCIGIIGYGNMGSMAAEAYLKAGYKVYVWNRTYDKIPSRKGIYPMKRIRDLVFLCREIIILVSDDDASANVLLGEDGVFNYKMEDLLVINSTTISPIHSVIISRTARELGIRYVNAPIMGGPKTLLTGENLILIDGDEDAYLKASECLKPLSREIQYVGRPPNASVIKLILNSISFVNAQVLSEVLALADSWNLDIDILSQAASKTWIKAILDKYLNRILNEDYPTSFRMRLAAKDLFYTEAAGYYKDQPLPIISTAMKTYLEASQKGYRDEDYTRIYYFLRANRLQ